jgi:hypothetical protein
MEALKAYCFQQLSLERSLHSRRNANAGTLDERSTQVFGSFKMIDLQSYKDIVQVKS